MYIKILTEPQWIYYLSIILTITSQAQQFIHTHTRLSIVASQKLPIYCKKTHTIIQYVIGGCHYYNLLVLPLFERLYENSIGITNKRAADG